MKRVFLLQIGVLAAAALVGLDDAEERMGRDHEHAKLLARGNESPFVALHIHEDIFSFRT